MRYYQWNDSSYQNCRFAGHELLFCGDIDGGVRCECGYCKEEIDIYDDMEECPKCHGHLVFPRADW